MFLYYEHFLLKSQLPFSKIFTKKTLIFYSFIPRSPAVFTLTENSKNDKIIIV